MRKKIFAMVLSLFLMIEMVPLNVLASTDTDFIGSGGSGSVDDPWLISNKEDLIELMEFVNTGKAVDFDADGSNIGSFHGYYFKQTADIDLAGVDWEPIGYSEEVPFSGNYDGGNFIIKNMNSKGKLSLDGHATGGLFGWLCMGKLSNIHVRNANVEATGKNKYSYVGGITSIAFAAEIVNCSVMNSHISSKRIPNESNCAGGIAGYATGSDFKQCASQDNQIDSTCYGGGFVGELDDDNGVGNSYFTDCYAANCIITGSSDKGSIGCETGAFIGVTNGDLSLTNCYVYQCTLQEGIGNISYVKKGVFTGIMYSPSSAIHTTNCFYLAPISDNAGTATLGTLEQFADGTIKNQLGLSFMGGALIPVLKTAAADYQEVDVAIAAAEAMDKDIYVDFSAVTNAIKAVVRGKVNTEQSIVNGYADAINNAIQTLQFKPANYAEVDKAINKANALNRDQYEDFSTVLNAMNAVIRGKDIREQELVNQYARAIEKAIKELVIKDKTTNNSSENQQNQQYQKNTPKTGDRSCFEIWIFLLAAASLSLYSLRRKILS